MDHRHGFPADDESKVEEMLAICNDESLIKLSLNTHSISASSDSLVLDSDLVARLQKLKSPPPPITKTSEAAALPPADPEEVDILGADLASRLAALKQPSLPRSPQPSSADAGPKQSEPPPIEKRVPSADLSSALNAPDVPSPRNEELNREVNPISSSDAPELEKLLTSVKDQVRLAKAKGGQKASGSDDDAADEAEDSDDEIADSDVDKMVEWAKDASRLGVCDDSEGDEVTISDKEDREEVSNPHPAKKTSKGWKFW